MSELVPIPGTIFLKTLARPSSPPHTAEVPVTTTVQPTLAGMTLIALEIISRVRPEDALSATTYSALFRRYARRIRSNAHSKARGLVALESFHCTLNSDGTYEVFGVATFAMEHLGFVGQIVLEPDPQIMHLRVLE